MSPNAPQYVPRFVALDIPQRMHDYAHLLVTTMPTDIEQRDRRRRAIVELVRRSRIASQEELLEQLAARGFEATQPSVSRDLRDLGVAKAGGRYVLADELRGDARRARRGGALSCSTSARPGRT